MDELFDSVNSDLAINVVNAGWVDEDEKVIFVKCVEENIKILQDYIKLQKQRIDELLEASI